MAKIKNALNRGRGKFNAARSDYSRTYNTGYKSGASDYEKAAQRFGSRPVLIVGYINGVNGARRNYKFKKKVNR